MGISIVIAVLSCIGFLLIAFAIIGLMTGFDEDKNKNTVFFTIGTLLLLGSFIYISIDNEKTEEELINNIAIMLETTPDKMVVQDISETKFLGPSKNENLRKVYANSKVYYIEIQDQNVLRISEEP